MVPPDSRRNSETNPFGKGMPRSQIPRDRIMVVPAIASLSTISSSLNSLFRVLCIFPLRYLCAIGLPPVFSLGWSIPPSLGLHFQATRLPNHLLARGEPQGWGSNATGVSPSLPALFQVDLLRPSLKWTEGVFKVPSAVESLPHCEVAI